MRMVHIHIYLNVYVERNLEIDLTIILIIKPSFIETAANSGWWPANDHISRYLTTLFIWSETIISPIVILLQCNGLDTHLSSDWLHKWALAAEFQTVQTNEPVRRRNQLGHNWDLKREKCNNLLRWSHYPSWMNQKIGSCVGLTQH